MAVATPFDMTAEEWRKYWDVEAKQCTDDLCSNKYPINLVDKQLDEKVDYEWITSGNLYPFYMLARIE